MKAEQLEGRVARTTSGVKNTRAMQSFLRIGQEEEANGPGPKRTRTQTDHGPHAPRPNRPGPTRARTKGPGAKQRIVYGNLLVVRAGAGPFLWPGPCLGTICPSPSVLLSLSDTLVCLWASTFNDCAIWPNCDHWPLRSTLGISHRWHVWAGQFST